VKMWQLRQGMLMVALTSLSLLAGGCSQIAEFRQVRGEEQALEELTERMRRFEKIAGRGTLVVEHRSSSLSMPFELRLAGSGKLEVELEVSPGLWPGMGKLRIVSDSRSTEIYSDGRRVDFAEADTLGQVLHPLLLSVFGGGDMLARWLVTNGCTPRRKTLCCGLEVDLRVSREKGSVERWTVKDRYRKASFTGFVYSWSKAGPFPRVLSGMIHPYEIGVTVEYGEMGLAGNFIQDPRFQLISGGK
jgi:hypothetical protein